MEAKKLEKVADEDLVAIDPKTVGQLTNETAEVEGQDPYIGRVECAWCGMRGRAILDTDYYKYFKCGNCGHMSKEGR